LLNLGLLALTDSAIREALLDSRRRETLAIPSLAEAEAVLSKAIRTKTLTRDEAASALQVFRSEWPSLVRVQTTETLIARADTLAWELGLRGYDAIHLASALVWQDGLGEPVTMATFDLRLWKAAERHSLAPFPDDLPAMLSEN